MNALWPNTLLRPDPVMTTAVPNLPGVRQRGASAWADWDPYHWRASRECVLLGARLGRWCVCGRYRIKRHLRRGKYRMSLDAWTVTPMVNSIVHVQSVKPDIQKNCKNPIEKYAYFICVAPWLLMKNYHGRKSQFEDGSRLFRQISII